MTESNSAPITQHCHIALASPDDEALIFDSWLNSYRHSDYARHVDQKVFYYRERQRLERVLCDERSVVLTARANDDPTQVYGYAVATFDDHKRVAWLHWVYVKQPFRRLGIGSALMAAVTSHAGADKFFNSYLTKPFFYWSQSKKFLYNPYYFDRIDV